MPNRIMNLVKTKGRWSFTAGPLKSSRHVVYPGEHVFFTGFVKNNGRQIGTVYVRILVADSYKLSDSLFDSNRDLPQNQRHSLRLVDIQVNASKDFACPWSIPAGYENRHVDVRLQVWNPFLLFGEPNAYLFFDSGWVGGFEILQPQFLKAKPEVFVSYSWDSEDHKSWVLQLAEELRKYDIHCVLDRQALSAGDETTRFMEQGITKSKVLLLICSEAYTKKVNSRSPGGVGFESVITSHEYMMCSAAERTRFIPVVRNNRLPAGKKLPIYLGSSFYVDMEGNNWQAEPMLDLVASIKRHF